MGRPTEARGSNLRALEICERLAREYPAVTEFKFELAGSHSNIAFMLSASGDYRRASDSYRGAISILSELAAMRPCTSEQQRELALNQNNLGAALWFASDFRRSVEAHRAGISTYENVLKGNPGNIKARDGLAECQANLGNALWGAGDVSAAAESYRQAVGTGKILVTLRPMTFDTGLRLDERSEVSDKPCRHCSVTTTRLRLFVKLSPMSTSHSIALRNCLSLGSL